MNQKIKPYRFYSDNQKLIAKDLCSYLGISIVTLWRWQKKGMPSHKTNTGRHYILIEVMEWLSEQPKLTEIYVSAKIKWQFRFD